MSAARLSSNASTRVFAASTRSYSTLSSQVARSTNTRTAFQNASLLTSARNTSNLNSAPISFGVSARLFSSTMTAPAVTPSGKWHIDHPKPSPLMLFFAALYHRPPFLPSVATSFSVD
uniref:Uncharacterized protein n=1 Tax=Kalmanozyma brasiliensis (strain GHG001) TaxID=1365824 RepID=V5EXU4_KALBG